MKNHHFQWENSLFYGHFQSLCNKITRGYQFRVTLWRSILGLFAADSIGGSFLCAWNGLPVLSLDGTGWKWGSESSSSNQRPVMDSTRWALKSVVDGSYQQLKPIRPRLNGCIVDFSATDSHRIESQDTASLVMVHLSPQYSHGWGPK